MNVKPAAQNVQDTSLLSLSDTLVAVSGKCVCSARAAASFCFTSVVTDSRNVVPGALFVPLVGEVQDGHAYIVPALEKGASVVFADQESYDCMDSLFMELQEEYPDVVFIIVRNTLFALQALAAAYVRMFPDLVRIGITGSSGKTTTKELVAAILSQKFSVVMNEGNLNSETGLPLSVFKIRSHHEVGVFELGMNRKGEIAEITSVLDPQLAVITNIGSAHIGILGSRDNIAYEKKQVFSHFAEKSTAFIPVDDDYAEFLSAGVPGKKVWYGTGCGVSGVEPCGLDGTRFILDGQDVLLPLPGRGNLCDALAAAAVAKELGCSSVEVKTGIESIKPLFGRSQIIHGDVTVVQDCYNANPNSMAQALEFFTELQLDCGSKIAVLGDMLELGDDSCAAHSETVGFALKAGCSFVVCVGAEICCAAKSICVPSDCTTSLVCFDDVSDSGIETVARFLQEHTQRGDVILLKGSRGMRLERITPFLTGGSV